MDNLKVIYLYCRVHARLSKYDDWTMVMDAKVVFRELQQSCNSKYDCAIVPYSLVFCRYQISPPCA